MSEAVVHRLDVEGADPLLLAGVNDVNLLELQRSLGVRASLRGDLLTLNGTADAVERAIPVLRQLLEPPGSVEVRARRLARASPSSATWFIALTWRLSFPPSLV